MSPFVLLVGLVSITMVHHTQAMPATYLNDDSSIHVSNSSFPSGKVEARLAGYIRYDDSDSTRPLDIHKGTVFETDNNGRRFVLLTGGHIDIHIGYLFEGMKPTHDQGYLEFFLKNETPNSLDLMCVIKTYFDLEPIDKSHYTFKMNGPWGCSDFVTENVFAEVKLISLELVIEDPELVQRRELIE